ncbi:MAG: OmpA family protein [Chitinophagaceae bacterium]|nr:MAG: OmpA family protein [Chitinophagaceae bacterium]
MRYSIVTIILLLGFFFQSQAQLGGLLNKAKSKVQQRADKKVDDAMEKGLDKAEGKNPKSNNSTASNNNGSQDEGKQDENLVKSYSRFDFIPGDSLIYTEDFQQDEVGEFPLNWNTAGKGDVVTLNSFPGKWLRLYENSLYLTSNKKAFSKNFTLEFDLILQLKSTGYTYPILSFGFFASNEDSTTDNKFLSYQAEHQSAQIYLRLGEGNTSYTYLNSNLNKKTLFRSENQELSNIEKFYNKTSHIAVQVQEQRLRIWVNGEKKYDLPKALGNEHIFNQVFFHLTTSSYKDEELGFYISNLKVATGRPDTRHKLVEEGKFSTTGILFDFQSAVIKPESYGVIKEIAGVLKENGSIKVKVIGHTSSDGDDKANMELSQRRAAAVKDLLVKEFGIDETRLGTEGKGETQPIADNKTKEGKTANRRVEFIKL